MNIVNLIGRLANDVKYSETINGIANAVFSLAVQRIYKNAEGKYDADFVNCVAWRKTAENIDKFCQKGSRIGITGHLNTRNYENKDGQKVYVTEVIVDNFDLLGDNLKEQSNEKVNNQTNNFQDMVFHPLEDEDLPF